MPETVQSTFQKKMKPRIQETRKNCCKVQKAAPLQNSKKNPNSETEQKFQKLLLDSPFFDAKKFFYSSKTRIERSDG